MFVSTTCSVSAATWGRVAIIKTMNEIKLCECGCGSVAPIAQSTRPSFGHVKGKPLRFIKGHNSRTSEGRARAAELCRTLGKSRTGELNHMWRGEDAGYDAKHDWINRHYPRTGTCEECGTDDRKTEWSNPDHTYRRVRSDWRELCIPCHRLADDWAQKVRARRYH